LSRTVEDEIGLTNPHLQDRVVKTSLMHDRTRLWSVFVTNAVSTIELRIYSAQQCGIFQYTTGNKYILIVNGGYVSSKTLQWHC